MDVAERANEPVLDAPAVASPMFENVVRHVPMPFFDEKVFIPDEVKKHTAALNRIAAATEYVAEWQSNHGRRMEFTADQLHAIAYNGLLWLKALAVFQGTIALIIGIMLWTK